MTEDAGNIKDFEKIEHFRNMKDYPKGAPASYMPEINLYTEAEKDEIEKKRKRCDLNVFRSTIMALALKFEREVLGDFENYDPPDMPTASLPEDHKACAPKMQLNTVKEEVEGQRREIDRIPPACDNLAHNYLRDEVQAAVDKGEDFLITLANPAGRIERYYIAKVDFPDFQARIREKIEILQEARKIRDEVFAVYAAELKMREGQSSAVVAAAIKEAEPVVKEAQKMIRVMTKACEKCKGPDITDLAAAEAWILARERYRVLESRYTAIRLKLEKFVTFADVASKLPKLPVPSVEACENESRIRDFARLERYSRDCAKEKEHFWNR